MPNQWGVSPLGNLSEFPIPAFHTGEGLAAILALRQRQAENITENIGDSIAQAMEQRRKDQMTNALLQRQAAKDPLELELLRARIARANRPAAIGGGGGGGGGAAAPETGQALGPDIVEKDGIKYEVKRTRYGIRYERLPGQTVRGAGGTTGDAGAELFKKYGLKPEELSDVTAVERVNVSRGVATPAEEGSHVRVQGGPIMPFADYLKYARKTAAPIAAATPPPNTGTGGTTTDSKQALARQALADPNATEAEKAQARKILGQ